MNSWPTQTSQKYSKHTAKSIATWLKVDAEHFEKEGNPEFAKLAMWWADWYDARWKEYDEVFNKDVIGAFKRLQEEGAIEIMTCGLTHGYLPLLAEEESVDRQLSMAKANYRKHFGRDPRGVWLPECAYRPSYSWQSYLLVDPYMTARHRDGVEQFLERHDLEFFVTDHEHLEGSRPLYHTAPDGRRTPFEETFGDARRQLEERSVFDLFKVSGTDHTESAVAFARHRDICMQVWSGDSGYPGDADYLDFHKKYFRSSLRYWRVTDNKADMQYKQAYVANWAEDRARSHADHFVKILEGATQHRQTETGRPLTACLPFDTELFGHWWFEGPLFMEHVLRGIHHSPVMHTSTASEQVDLTKPTCEVGLPESSWGAEGNHSVWMNDDVKWTWEKEYRLEYRVKTFLEKNAPSTWDKTAKRVLVNVMRQLLLAQASDWQFLITTWSSREYAEMRFHNHVSDANKLLDLAESVITEGHKLTKEEEQFVAECEDRDDIFIDEINSYFDSLG